MAEEVGNVLHVPGMTSRGPTTDDEILASYQGLTQKGLTMLLTASTVWKTGTVIKVSGTAKKYTGALKADVGTPAVGTTSAVTVGILRKSVDVSTSDMQANVVLHGVIRGSAIKYADDTDGLTVPELQSLAIALNGRYVAYNDMLFF